MPIWTSVAENQDLGSFLPPSPSEEKRIARHEAYLKWKARREEREKSNEESKRGIEKCSQGAAVCEDPTTDNKGATKVLCQTGNPTTMSKSEEAHMNYEELKHTEEDSNNCTPSSGLSERVSEHVSTASPQTPPSAVLIGKRAARYRPKNRSKNKSSPLNTNRNENTVENGVNAPVQWGARAGRLQVKTRPGPPGRFNDWDTSAGTSSDIDTSQDVKNANTQEGPSYKQRETREPKDVQQNTPGSARTHESKHNGGSCVTPSQRSPLANIKFDQNLCEGARIVQAHKKSKGRSKGKGKMRSVEGTPRRVCPQLAHSL